MWLGFRSHKLLIQICESGFISSQDENHTKTTGPLARFDCSYGEGRFQRHSHQHLRAWVGWNFQNSTATQDFTARLAWFEQHKC